jgi:hypothetical protein
MIKNMNIKKIMIIFVLLLFIFLAIRIAGLNSPLYDDEVDHLLSKYNPQAFGLNPHSTKPPLISWMNLLFSHTFGDEIWKFRGLMVLFGMSTLILTFLLSKKLYQNNKAALISTTIMGFSFYHILGSLQVGSYMVLAFFYLVFFMSYLHYKSTGKKKFLIASGIVWGLALLLRESAVLMLLIVGIYELLDIIKKKDWKLIVNKTKIILPILLIGGAMFSIFPLLNHLASLPLVDHVVGNVGKRLKPGFSLMGFSMFLFWSTPFLVGLFSISAIKGFKEKNNKLPLIWFFTVFLFYIILIPILGDFSTYFVNLIIPMSLVSGYFLSKIKWKTKYWWMGGIVFILANLMFNRLNKGVLEYVPRFMDLYLSRLMNFDWNFLFTYTGSSGPLFFFSFKAIMIAYIISTILIIYFFVFKDKKAKQYFLVIFIAFSFAFNVGVAQEYLFHTNHPDPGEAINNFVDYYEINKGQLIKPYYTNNVAMLFYLDRYYLLDLNGKNEKYYYMGVYGEYMEKVKKLTEQKGGTVFLLAHPPTPKDSPLWDVADSCELKKEFKSKGKTFVFIFEC